MNKKDVILKTAQKLFSQFGLNKVNMEEIAREARVSKATLYKYYKDKSEVFREVVRIETEQLITAIGEAVAQEATVRGKLKAHLLTKLKKIHHLINFYRVTQESWNDHWPYIEEVNDDFISKEKALVADIIQLGNERGETAVKDVEMTAHIAVVAQKSLEYSWAINGGADEEELADSMIEIFYNGISNVKQAETVSSGQTAGDESRSLRDVR
ncbi:MAG: TetR/AcrR family transcriptional regulator [FCB group bacterium]|nr:TetR/AcrR family transcriptional regulator [FCB group bacterium]